MKTKQCRRCEKVLPASEFNKKKGSIDGLQSYCRKCAKEIHHQYYLQNRDIFIAKAKKYLEEHREQRRQYDRMYYQKHRGDIIKKRLESYYAHRELKRQRVAEMQKQIKSHLASCGKQIVKANSRPVECIRCRKVSKSNYDKCLMFASVLDWEGWEVQ